MKFEFTPAQDRFRSELREFLSAEMTPAMATGGMDRSFSKKLAANGWIGIAWPEEYGGGGKGAVEQMIYNEEMILANAPRGYHFTAERQVGPSVILHGTEDQKREWLPKIMNADVSFALGLSEPGAGSDLAAVTTRAVRDGDDYVISGQKIWTSNAHQADSVWLVTRTDPNAPKHRGISCILVDLDSPGVEVRPLRDLTYEHHFNEVFFENVRVPVDRRVGEENRGWYILAEHLDFERSGIERLIDLQWMFDAVIAEARRQRQAGTLSHTIRTRIAEIALEREVGRLLCYRVAWMQGAGLLPNAEASESKAFGTEWSQRLAGLALQLFGMHGTGTHESTFAARLQKGYRNAASRTVAGGTSEIQRNIIATRGLGLPRG